VNVTIDLAALRSTNWKQYAMRFVIGGLITVAAGLIAKGFGPEIGGLFLAFPAIFPATATLIAKREREKKRRKGLDGMRRGVRAAALDAAGTVLGASALIVYASVLWRFLPRYPPAAVIAVALCIWAVLSTALWWLRKKI
jgi:4-hydroxybenzoate polyprenyltransferase